MRDPEPEAARAGIAGIDQLLRGLGQRRTLTDLGLGPETHDTIAQDAVDDAAINNSPRLPDRDDVVAILARVA